MTIPKLVIIAGPNGSGKSTLTDRGNLSQFGVSIPEKYINPDEITKDIQENDIIKRNREGWLQARRLREEYREKRISFAFETVFSHPSTLLDMYECQKAGYEISLIYVTTGNPDINISRVQGRVLEGGHDVPVDKIRERYRRSLSLLPRMVEDANRAFIFDSTHDGPMQVCFLKSTYGHIYNNPPLYLQKKLIDPLTIRMNERNHIASQYENVIIPDERIGQYEGRIRIVKTNYILQEIKPNVFIRHDVLLTGNITSNVTAICYKDGDVTLL